MSAAVSIRGLHKRFREREVLRGIDLEVRRGESFGLIGANGAGKTTLLKAILDYITIDAGNITLFDVPARQARARRRLAFLPEQFLPPHFLRGRDFLSYICRLHGVSPGAEELARIAAVVQLDEASIARSVSEFSKGMAQKLGLAATFLSDKELMILDEPMNGLDPAARASIKQHIRALRDGGTTLLFTTHLLSDVEVLCDRIGILGGGALRFVGTPAECRAHYGCDSLEEAYLRSTAEK